MADCSSSVLVFYVNGTKVVEQNPDPEETLLFYLRNKLRFTGTKLGCSEGGCGACTVMVSSFNRNSQKIHHMSVNACLAPVCSMHGLAVTTVEGIGSTKTRLHPVQERLAKSHGSQCGFCTPGIVMSMYTLLRNQPQPTVAEMENAFEGNLCRCTGYRPILQGFRSLTKEFQCGMGEKCCRNQKPEEPEENNQASQCRDETFLPYDPSQEPIFPSELQLNEKFDTECLVFRSARVTWYRPVTLDALLQLKEKYPSAKLVVGNTEVGVEVKFKNQHYPVIVSPTHVVELAAIEHTDGGVVFGGAVSLSKIDTVLRELINSKPAHMTRIYKAVVEMLRWFAGNQVRNVAAIAGNIVTASPISDLNPLWLAAGCIVTLASKAGGIRQIKMDDKFYQGYRQTALKSDEVLISIQIPYTSQNEYFYGYKQAHRRDDDIAIVNAGFKVTFEEGSTVVQNISMAFGGMAPFTVMALKTMTELVGKRWEEDLVSEACRLLAEDLPLPPGTPGGMEPYRRTLTTSLFFKFFLTVTNELHMKQLCEGVPDSHASATPVFFREPSRGNQVYEEIGSKQAEHDEVGRPMQHVSASKQVTGEAIYVDDMPPIQGELFLALVMGAKAHAKILQLDSTAALAMPGVVDVISHSDVPGSNVTGSVFHDEEIFASDKVVCLGQPVAAVLAHTPIEAQRAAKAVVVQYEELAPIITIQQAIEANSYFAMKSKITTGNIEDGFRSSDHVIEDELYIGGQEHFYLETIACIAVPKLEDGEMEIFCSTQNPHQIQMAAASALGVPANRVVCRVKRMGGGFGGKETRSAIVALPVAVAANKTGRSVRCMLDRDEDMVMSGTRHPFLAKYKVGFTNEGKILSLKLDLYCNAGYSVDLSAAVMERAVLHSDNCYNIPNICVSGFLCKTNTPSNTAFRGFGGPQGLLVCENWMTQVAEKLCLPQQKVRELNLYNEGEHTHFNMLIDNCNIKRCWTNVVAQSHYNTRLSQVQDFNRKNRWKKRGIAIVPVKFGISFTLTRLNQAGALLLVYVDGSVLLTHGGTEMGQGLHTKMIQVASRALGIPASKIFISETSTNTVPNSSPTAASASSDLNGMAVLDACETIMKRLEPVKQANPQGSWESWIAAAYSERISLSATGFYKTPGISYDWETNTGNPFHYFTTGAGVSEVEIDCLTGDHTVLRTDIVMDLGNSLNPAIDIGQIEGAFVQGYGLFTMEEQRYTPKGYLLTRGPGFYKIPGFTDIPVEFNVSLLKEAPNPKAVYSSKAVGEPPLFLAASVFFAIRQAVISAREDACIDGSLRLDSPATAERIRMACKDKFTKQFPPGEPGTFTPWFVNH